MSKMIILVINDDEKLERILEGFIEIGIRGATIIDSMGMARFMRENTTAFSNLFALINNDRKNNKTVFTVTSHPCKLEKAVGMIREIMDDFKNPDSGLLIVLPVSRVYGFARGLDEPTDC